MKERSTFLRQLGFHWAIPALLAVFVVISYWKVLFTSVVMLPWDASDFFYPYLSFVHEELRHFHLPLWNPFVMSGYPIIGDMEAQIFYPLNWLFVALSPSSPLPARLVEIQVVFHFFLAGLFMFYLARDVTGKNVPALLGGVLFMASGAMVAHTEHLAIVDAMAWYPLIFLVARRALFNGKWSWTIGAGLLFGVQLLVGHWQHSAYMGLLIFLYFAWHAVFGPRRAKVWPRWILQLLLVAGIGVGLALVQILPSIELGLLSVRNRLGYWDITSGNPPAYLWTLFLPNVFGGLDGVPMTRPYDLSLVYVFITVPGILLALLGIVETIRRRNFYYLITIPVLVFLSFGWHGPLGPVLYAIPILNRFRNPGMLFNPVNFLLCLMAALGAKALFGGQPWLPLKKYLPWILTVLLAFATIVGLVRHLGTEIPGWYGMLAVLALFSLAVTAYLRGRIGPGIALGAVLALILFQLIHYNTNQRFNWSLNDPDSYATRDRALGSTGLLQFLRSDPNQDFRTWTAAENILSTNGWNIWRIPTISGWNPITLESYQNYIQEFIQCGDYTSPNVGGDHELQSPMLDLLGTKYLISMGGEVSNFWTQSGKLRSVSTDFDWWRVFENKDYLSRAWFYPHAYTVPDKALTTALMKSRWFEARKMLLFDRADLPLGAEKLTEELSAIHLLPDQVEAASRGRAATDPGCAQPQKYFRDWNGEGNWVRFRISGLNRPGRYTILFQYTSAYQGLAGAVETSMENGDLRQSSPPLVLPRTAQYNCASKRTAELGEFTLAPGSNILTLTLRRITPVDLYSLWLVRLPETTPSNPGTLAFRDSSYTPNRISLTADIPEDGFLLLNEIYYPGWEAVIDGDPAAICRVDGIFRGLRVSSGTHRIQLQFRPRHFLLGAVVSLGTLILSLACMVALRRRDRKSGD